MQFHMVSAIAKYLIRKLRSDILLAITELKEFVTFRNRGVK